MREIWYCTWIFPVIRPFRGYDYFYTLWPWSWSLTFLTLPITFCTVIARALIFHMVNPCDKTFSSVSLFLTLWPEPLSPTYFQKTLTLLITFELWLLELWYFTWVFLVARPFRLYLHFWPCDLDLSLKFFYLANEFLNRVLELWIRISHEYFKRQDLSMDTNIFDLVTLTLEFELLFEIFNFVNHIWILRARALIFHMSIPWDKIFLLVLTFWPWHLTFF